eukprot:354744-Chlamydomonas_euryale.AAC.3
MDLGTLCRLSHKKQSVGCTKGLPKPFRHDTLEVEGYFHYRRRPPVVPAEHDDAVAHPRIVHDPLGLADDPVDGLADDVDALAGLDVSSPGEYYMDAGHAHDPPTALPEDAADPNPDNFLSRSMTGTARKLGELLTTAGWSSTTQDFCSDMIATLMQRCAQTSRPGQTKRKSVDRVGWQAPGGQAEAVDEVKEYLDARFIGSSETCHKLLALKYILACLQFIILKYMRKTVKPFILKQATWRSVPNCRLSATLRLGSN